MICSVERCCRLDFIRLGAFVLGNPKLAEELIFVGTKAFENALKLAKARFAADEETRGEGRTGGRSDEPRTAEETGLPEDSDHTGCDDGYGDHGDPGEDNGRDELLKLTREPREEESETEAEEFSALKRIDLPKNVDKPTFAYIERQPDHEAKCAEFFAELGAL